MALWVMILLVTVGVPGLGAFWWAGRVDVRREKARLRLLDGDQYETDEMMVAFGATQEWV